MSGVDAYYVQRQALIEAIERHRRPMEVLARIVLLMDPYQIVELAPGERAVAEAHGTLNVAIVYRHLPWWRQKKS